MKKHMTEMAREFHEKHGFDQDLKLEDIKREEGSGTVRGSNLLQNSLALKWASKKLLEMSKTWENGTSHSAVPCSPDAYDTRLMRAHLQLEELAEELAGLAECDEKKVLDGLADLSYVTAGAAVAFGLPLEAAEREVHRSNMTKAVRGAAASEDPRLRNKGASYEPPDLERVLRDHRLGAVDNEQA